MSAESYNLFRGELIGAGLTTALKALNIAERAHAGVLRKDGKTPYVEHPAKVASILFDLGIRNESILSAALLHDVFEDCPVERVKGEIYLLFPTEVNEAISTLTKTAQSNDMYYGRIKLNRIATLVKLADRVHNLSTLNSFTEEKKKKYVEETKEFVYPLIKYAQHTYYEYIHEIRILDLWIETVINNLEGYMPNDD